MRAAEAAKDSTISVHQLKAMLEARDRGEQNFLLVDVREPNEWDISRIPGAELIPRASSSWVMRCRSSRKDKPTVLYCKVGGDLLRCWRW